MVTRTAPRNNLIWTWVVIAFVLDIAGAQHVYTLPTVAASALSALALALILPGTFLARAAPDQPPELRVLLLLPVAGFVAAMVDVAAFVPVDLGWTRPRLALLVAGVVALLLAPRRGVLPLALMAALLGIVIRAMHFDAIPIKPENGDMLPLVRGALNNLLAGESPYRMYQMPWNVPLTYLPVTWLAYMPTYLLDVDLRWTNVAAELTVLGILLWLTRQSREAADRRGELAVALWSWLFLQPSVIHWDAGNTAPITWVLLAGLLALVLAGTTRAAAVALGLTAAGTPLSAVFGSFVALHWLRRWGVGGSARLLALAGLVAAALVLPFALWAPHDFLVGTYRWFNTIDGWPRQKWLETDPHIWSIITGFSGEFWSRGTERWLKPIQALVVGLVALVYSLRGARSADLCQHAAAAYLGFMLFNPVLWPYLYNPVLFAGLIGIAALGLPEQRPVTIPASLAKPRASRPTTI